MRARSVTRAVALVGLAAACGVLSFDVDQPIPEQVVQGSPLGGLAGVLPPALFQVPITIDLESTTRARGTGPATAAHLKSVTLSIRTPPGQTFDFVDALTIKVSADGLPEREVARLPSRQSTRDMHLQIVPGVDILPYVKKGCTMTATATGHAPPQETHYDGKVVVTIDV
jgi:hypothetical protein